MFKIIKTSTYKYMEKELDLLRENNSLYIKLDFLKDSKIQDLELQLHTLTAKKLPIKKSKNK